MNEDNEADYCEAVNDLENAKSLIVDLRMVRAEDCDPNALAIAQSHIQQALFFLKEARR